VDVLIVGAGVGGLALANGLLADGHPVRVLERADALRRDGAAVTIASNGAAALAGLGVALAGIGATVELMDFRDAAGRRLAEVDLRVVHRRTGFGFATAPRERLVDRLAAGLPAGTIRFGHPVEDVVATGPGAVVDAGGGRHRADVVVGADGQGSVVRAAVLDPTPAADAGWSTWQGLSRVLPAIATGHRGLFLAGPAGFVGLMPAGEGWLQWWFDVPVRRSEASPAAPVRWLRERFAGYADPVPELLDAVDDGDVARYPHVLHRVPDRWGTGPTTLLGDAAHAFPPSQAQGANQALEDAWLLRRALARPGDPAPALRDYEHRRGRRVRRVSRLAASQITNRSPNRLARAARAVPGGLAGLLYERVIRSWSDVLG
jgi:FAD-dependent urate hydroxylase